MFSQSIQVTEQPSGFFASCSRSRSSSVTSWDSLHGNAPSITSFEQSSTRYSAPLCQGEMQQELVVKAIRVKKKRRRRSRQGKQTVRQAVRQTDGLINSQTDSPIVVLSHRQWRQRRWRQSSLREQLFRLHVYGSGRQLQ